MRAIQNTVENLESAKANENRHPTFVMEGESVSRSSLYMKEMDQHHILLIQKRFSLDHLLLMHDTGQRCRETCHPSTEYLYKGYISTY